ncbi:MAG: ATP-binding cassette domain-containing protein, partial [Pseudomonadota bacterium]
SIITRRHALRDATQMADTVYSEARALMDQVDHNAPYRLIGVGLSHLAGAYPHHLSGGEQQRVALARAIAPRPAVMLLDEPFSGLDERLRDEVRDQTIDVLREEGTAIVLVTHDPVEAMRMGDEIALMRHGRIVQRGAPYTVYNDPVDLEAAAFFSDINVIEGLVEAGLINTPFGPFFAPGLEDGTRVDIAVRPQHVHIDFDRPGGAPRPTEALGAPAHSVVTRARFLGRYSLVDFKLDDGTVLAASVPGVFLPRPDTPFFVTIPRRHCKVFARA